MRLSCYFHSHLGQQNLQLWQPTAYYTQDYYGDAIFELERYLVTYPNHKDKVYAHFLLGMSFYEQIVDEKKDLKSILDSKEQFETIIRDYPSTEFAWMLNLK